MTIDSVCGFSSAKICFFFSRRDSCCCYRAVGYASCLWLFLLFLQYTHDFRKMPYIRWSRCRAHGSKKSLLLLYSPFCSSLPPRLACCHFIIISKIAKITMQTTPGFLSLPQPLHFVHLSLYTNIATAKNLLFCSPLNIVDVFSFSIPRLNPAFYHLLSFADGRNWKSSDRAYMSKADARVWSVSIYCCCCCCYFFLLPCIKTYKHHRRQERQRLLLLLLKDLQNKEKGKWRFICAVVV